MSIKLMDGLDKMRAFQEADMDTLMEYVDYLEGEVRNYHMHAGLLARAAGGDVPERETWGADHPMCKKRKP